ncbi:MAG: ABC transporter permease [Planctomycetia bacterium]|nr:ABC transporter permease [Planctomycetia bacterium]
MEQQESTIIEDIQQSQVPASQGYWRETWRRFRRRKLAMCALVYVCIMALVAIFSPAIAGTKPIICKYKGQIYFPCLGYFFQRWENPIFITDGVLNKYPTKLKENDPDSWAIFPLMYNDITRRVKENEMPGRPGNPAFANGVPSAMNPCGTNAYGYDVAAMMIHGTRIALLVGFISTGIAAMVGICIGALAGYFGGWVDMILSRFIEVVMCVPTLVLILAFIAILERPSIFHTMAIIGLTTWPGIARLTRGEFMKLKQSEYVTAARSLGTGQLRIIFRHILPNALAPVLVPITFGIAAAILTESGLSFLGVGSSVSTASWGKILSEGRSNLSMWWLTFFPGLAIFLTVLAYNLIGEALQEATDPRLREAGK